MVRFAGHFLEELLLTFGDDRGVGDAAALILDAVDLGADPVGLLAEDFGLGDGFFLFRAVFHRIRFVGCFFRGTAGFQVELLLRIGAFAVGGVDFGGFLEASEGLLRRETVHAVGDLAGLKDALLHLLAAGLIDHVWIRIDERDKAVPHLLGAHAAEERPGEVIHAAGGVFLTGNLGLVGLGVVKDAQHGLHVVFVIDDELFEVLFHLWNHRHGGVHEFVERLDEGEAENALPEAVGDDGGEARVFRAGHPARVGLQRRFAGLGDALVAHHGAGGDGGLGLGVAVLIIVGQRELGVARADAGVAHGVAHIIHGLLVAALFFAQLILGRAALFLHDLHFGLVGLVGVRVGLLSGGALFLGHFAGDLRALWTLRFLDGGTDGILLLAEKVTHLSHDAAVVVLRLHAVGEGGHFEELHLRPFVEGVIMALRALDAGAEEDARGVGHVVQRHAAVTHVVTDGAVLPGLALGRDHLSDELVVGLVFTQRLLHEVRIRRAGDLAGLITVAREAQHVRPVVVEVLHICLRVQQLVDQLGAFVCGLVGKKRIGFPGGGNAADHVQIDASDESIVIRG